MVLCGVPRLGSYSSTDQNGNEGREPSGLPDVQGHRQIAVDRHQDGADLAGAGVACGAGFARLAAAGVAAATGCAGADWHGADVAAAKGCASADWHGADWRGADPAAA